VRGRPTEGLVYLFKEYEKGAGEHLGLESKAKGAGGAP